MLILSPSLMAFTEITNAHGPQRDADHAKVAFVLFNLWGSGGGSVGRAVASNSRGPRFESSHRQKFILNIYCQLY